MTYSIYGVLRGWTDYSNMVIRNPSTTCNTLNTVRIGLLHAIFIIQGRTSWQLFLLETIARDFTCEPDSRLLIRTQRLRELLCRERDNCGLVSGYTKRKEI